jgi:hypothetical protein
VVTVSLGNRAAISAGLENSQKYMMAQSASQDRTRNRTFTELRRDAAFAPDFSGGGMTTG